MVGLIDGIATGNSTVSTLLKCVNIPVVDTNVLAQGVVEPGMAALRTIVREFS